MSYLLSPAQLVVVCTDLSLERSLALQSVTGSMSELACGLKHVTMMVAVSSSMVALKLYV